MWLSVLSAVTSIFTPCHTESAPCLPNTHPQYVKSNSQGLIIIVTSVDHVKCGLSALEGKQNETTGRREGNVNHEAFYDQRRSSPII